MSDLTITVPIGNRLTRKEVSHVEVTGKVVGPFLVHRTPEHGALGYSVTHIKTAFAALTDLPHRRAMWLARRLSKLDCWEFDDPDVVKLFAPELLGKIHTLRNQARNGDMQGEQA